MLAAMRLPPYSRFISNGFKTCLPFEMQQSGDGNETKLWELHQKNSKKREKLKQRRLAKEARRQKVIKDHYEREMKLCQLNFEKCEEKWNNVLDKFTTDDLKWDLLVFKENFSGWVKIKSIEFDSILQCFEDLGDDNRKLAAAHLGGLDQLIGLYYSRVDDAQKDFSESLTQTKAAYQAEETIVSTKEKAIRENQSTIISHQKEKGLQAKNSGKNFLDETILELDSKQFTDMEKLKNDFDDTVEWLVMNLQVKIKTFLYTSKEKYQEYQELKAKDQAGLEKTFKYCFEIKKQMQKISGYKQKSRIAIQKHNIPHVRADKRTLSYKLSMAAKKMSKYEKEDRESLKLLSTAAQQSITHLIAVWNRRKKILCMKELCENFTKNKEYCKWDGIWAEMEIIGLKNEISKLSEEQVELKLSLTNVLRKV